MKRKFVLTAILSFLAVNICSAQWEPAFQLTNVNGGINYNEIYNNTRYIAANGNVVHAVWFENRDGNNEIYYKRSTDGGINWGANTRLTNDIHNSAFPSLAVSGSIVHIVWLDNRDSSYEIYYKRSTDGGINWGVDTRLTYNLVPFYHLNIAVSGSIIHIVWDDLRDGSQQIYYKRSTNGGITWGTDIRLTDGNIGSTQPSISASGLNVHIVWEDLRDNGSGYSSDIYYKHSTDGGINWGADTRLSNTPSLSGCPSVAFSGSNVHVAWYDNRYYINQWSIFYKRSTDGGITWGGITHLTNDTIYSVTPSVAVSGPNVHIVWEDGRLGHDEIYYKRSTNNGVSWEADTRLTNDTIDSGRLSIAISGTAVHVIWIDISQALHKIYYTRNPTGNVIGIKNISTEVPKSFSLEQNYPNPFNPSTNIKYQIAKSGLVTLKIYDILGKVISTLVNEKQGAGTYEVTFNSGNLPSGVYFYQLKTENFLLTKKLLLIK